MGPLLTFKVHAALQAAATDGAGALQCSLDLERSTTTVEVGPDYWTWQGQRYPFMTACKERTIYYWAGEGFDPDSRYTRRWISRFPPIRDHRASSRWHQDAPYRAGLAVCGCRGAKVGFIRPRGKVILDTCGGLGYFAAWCLQGQAARVQSFEKNPDVIWLRDLNPWSPPVGGALQLVNADVAAALVDYPERSFDAVLHDPPRFGIAGELYSQAFYDQLARVLKPRGMLFHYTGTPNKLTSGRDVPKEVARRCALPVLPLS